MNHLAHSTLLPRPLRDAITQIEKSFPVGEWKINGVHIWPRVRLDLYMRAIGGSGTAAPAAQSLLRGLRAVKRVAESFPRTVCASAIDWRKNAQFDEPADVVIFTSAHGRQLPYCNSHYHVLFD